MKTKNKILYVSPYILANLPKETPVLLAFSGGADSSALLSLLAEDSIKNGFSLSVAHFNHQIRGEEAERDARFCEGEAEKYNLPFYLGSADVPALAKDHKNSLENEAREQRYAFFEKVMRENGIQILVTAHHAEDNTETVLLHILRGSGIAGLCGIAPHRSFAGNLHLVRPILNAEKCDILALCNEKGINYVTDSTNDDTNYLRNAIRHEITPVLCELQPNLSQIFARLSDSARDADDLISTLSNDFLNSSTDENGNIALDKFNELHPSIKARVLASIFEKVTGASLERVHIEAICEIAKCKVAHSSVSLPSKYSAVIENSALCFVRELKADEDVNFNIPFSEGNICATEGIIINIEKNPSDKIANDLMTIDIRADLIQENSCFRPRKEGDTIFCCKMNKKAKKLVSEKGLSLDLRKKLPLLVCGDDIFWIPSVAVCDKVKTAKIKDGDDFFRIIIKLENH